jgi:hypothetical protein
VLGLRFKGHSFDFSKLCLDWKSDDEDEILNLDKVWRPTNELGIEDLSGRFGMSFVDLPTEWSQWPSADLNSDRFRSELDLLFGKGFTGNYRQLLSTYSSTKFERQVGMRCNDMDSFIQAKHEYDNTWMSQSGTEVLAELQRRLQPSSLKHCSPDHGRALFLVLLATIFAAGKARREACGADNVR